MYRFHYTVFVYRWPIWGCPVTSLGISVIGDERRVINLINKSKIWKLTVIEYDTPLFERTSKPAQKLPYLLFQFILAFLAQRLQIRDGFSTMPLPVHYIDIIKCDRKAVIGSHLSFIAVVKQQQVPDFLIQLFPIIFSPFSESGHGTKIHGFHLIVSRTHWCANKQFGKVMNSFF